MKIAPSILDADFTKLQSELDSLKDCERIHLDIMDGAYVPATSFFAEDLKEAVFPIPAEVHLMCEDPFSYFEGFVDLGVMGITFHAETQPEFETIELLKELKEFGVKAGIAIDGYTDIEVLSDEILELADQVLVMTIKAGKGGQSFMPERLDMVKDLRKRGYKGEIEIDGGVKDFNWKESADAGVDIAVVGSFLMKSPLELRQERIKALQSI